MSGGKDEGDEWRRREDEGGAKFNKVLIANLQRHHLLHNPAILNLYNLVYLSITPNDLLRR